MSEWIEQSVPLNLDLGDRRLLQIPMRLLVKQAWLSQFSADAKPIQVPNESLPKGFRGFLVRSMPLVGTEGRLARAGKYLCYVRQKYQRCYIDLSLGFEQYEAKFSSKSRATLRRKLNKIRDENGGAIDWRKYTTPESLPEYFEYARRISVKTYQHRLFDAGLPQDEAFKARANELANQDRLRAYLLFHKGEPAAYLFCPVQGRALIYEFLGYDPQFMSLSVGTVLQWLALNDLFTEQKFSLFDFTEGESEHKRFFSTGRVMCGDVYFLRPSPLVLLTLLAQTAVDCVSKIAGDTLEKLGLKTRVKQFLRFGLGRS